MPSAGLAPPIWFLALTTSSGVIALTILTPILPLLKSELGASSSTVQLLLTCFLIAIAVGQLVCGPLSDRYGRRPVLLVGAVLYTLGSIAIFFSDQIQLLIVWRILQGFGGAACMSMARAIVNDVFDRSEAARQLSAISIVLSVAPALSLAFGGWLAEWAGWKATILVLVVVGLLVLIATNIVVTETNKHKLDRINPSSIATAYRSVLSNPLFVCWTLASGMQVGMFFCLNGLLGYQYQRNGYSLGEFGLWFSLTPLFYLVGNTLNRMWFVRRGIERAAMLGCSLSMVSVLAMLFTQAFGFTHALSLALPCCLFGFSNGIVIANSTVGAISTAGKHIGTGSGIVGAWQMAAGGIAGAIIVAIGGAQVFSIAAISLLFMAAVSVLSMVFVYRRREAV